MRERLPWASWQRVGRGLFEIDGVPDDVLRHFSQRRAEIEERAAELVGADAQARSAEHGFGPSDLAQLRARRPTDSVRPSFQAVTARLTGPDGLTATHNTFTRRHVVAELRDLHTERVDRDPRVRLLVRIDPDRHHPNRTFVD